MRRCLRREEDPRIIRASGLASGQAHSSIQSLGWRQDWRKANREPEPIHTERHDAYGTAPGRPGYRRGTRLRLCNPIRLVHPKSQSTFDLRVLNLYLRKGKRRGHFAAVGDCRAVLRCLVYRISVIRRYGSFSSAASLA